MVSEIAIGQEKPAQPTHVANQTTWFDSSRLLTQHQSANGKKFGVKSLLHESCNISGVRSFKRLKVMGVTLK